MRTKASVKQDPGTRAWKYAHNSLIIGLMHSDESYIITRLAANLGNQLFQFAAGQALSSELGLKHWVDARAVPDPDLLTKVGLRGVVPCPDKHLPPSRDRLGAYLFWRYGGRNPILLREGKNHHWGQSLPKNRPLYLHGYWQDARITENIKLDIRAPKTAPAESGLEAGTIAMHIRGGDFGDAKGQKIYTQLGAPYYTRAFALAQEHSNASSAVIFTNDEAHVHSLNLSFPYELAPEEQNSDQIGTLWAMSRYETIVIANSTFSWWAAWLGQAERKKIVIAPSHWTHAQTSDTHPIIPQGWLCVQP